MSNVNYIVGQTLGKYKIIEHVGHGGMAEVYKGQHIRLDRMVAIKILHPFLAEDEGFVVRFEREARIVATLRHPNIVQVFDFDHSGEFEIYYMVMEYIDGSTLKDRLQDGPLNPDDIGRLGISLAMALDYAHQRGMIHRDIKPANIMFTADNEAVLTDFGIAKMIDLSSLTATGAMVGTPAYMAPEIGLGKPGTALSDIYSLGVVLYHMATGQLPFVADTPMGMVMQHINDEPQPIVEQNPDFPPELEAVILKAMAKQPEARPKTAAEMANDLRYATGYETPMVMRSKRSVLTTSEIKDLTKDTAITPSRAVSQTDKLQMSAIVEPLEQQKKKRPSFFGRFLRVLLAPVFIVALILAGWWALDERMPIPFNQLLTLAGLPQIAAREVPTATPTPAMPATEETPVKVPLVIATPTSTPTPKATPIPEVCETNAKAEATRVEPQIAAPDVEILAYVTLRNTGNCTWPTGLQLAYISGDPLNPPEILTPTLNLRAPVNAVNPGKRIQIVIPLHTPGEIGTYESTWHILLPDGQKLGSAIKFNVEVTDIITPTPTIPVAAMAEEETVQEPLTLAEPVISFWRDDTQGIWYARLQLQAVGGTGNYRYFRGDTLQQDTELPDGTFEFTWQRCQAYPLKIGVISGAETAYWEGIIAYPAPENCR